MSEDNPLGASTLNTLKDLGKALTSVRDLITSHKDALGLIEWAFEKKVHLDWETKKGDVEYQVWLRDRGIIGKGPSPLEALKGAYDSSRYGQLETIE